MAVGDAFRSLKDIRPSGSEITVFDLIQIPGAPGAGEYVYRTVELPLNIPLANPHLSSIEVRETDSLGAELSGPVRLTPIYTGGTLLSGTFIIYDTTDPVDPTLNSFIFGKIKFSQLDGGRYFKVLYTGRGSLVLATDVLNNSLGTAIVAEAIEPGHLRQEVSDVYSFPSDINVAGDLNITGELNKSITEIITSSDVFLRLNNDFDSGSPTEDGGLSVRRGSETYNAEFTWDESADQWVIRDVGTGTLNPVVTTGSISRADFEGQTASGTYTGDDRIYDLPFTYTTGAGGLLVYANGMLQTPGAGNDYIETDSDTVTFEVGSEPILGANVSFVKVGV